MRMARRHVMLRVILATLCTKLVSCDTTLDIHPIFAMNAMNNGGPANNLFNNYFSDFSPFPKTSGPIISPMSGTGFVGSPSPNSIAPPLSGSKFYNFPRIPIGFVGLPSLPPKHPLSPLSGPGKTLPKGGPPYAPVKLPNAGPNGIHMGANAFGVLHMPPSPGPGQVVPGPGLVGPGPGAVTVDPAKLMTTQAVGMVVQSPPLAEAKFQSPAVDPQHHLPMNHLFVPVPVLKPGGGDVVIGPPPPVFADILIVVDTSSQMGQIGPMGEIVWNPGVINFITRLIQDTPMGPDLNRIGVVVVSFGIDDMIPLTADKPFLLESLGRLRPTFRGGCTEKGISTSSNLFYQYGRPLAVKRIVLIGEGSPKCPYRNMAEIMYAKKCGIDIVTVGFGPMLTPGIKGQYRSSWMVAGPDNLIDVVHPVATRAYIAPIHGGWSPWSAWNPCSSSGTCDIGYQMRFRLCDNPVANFGGRNCDGYPAETRLCHMTPCIDKTVGHWSPWSAFTPCSAPCGIGSRSRARSCLTLDGRPSAMCQGRYVEMSECLANHCPVHGGWSPWSAYGLCSVKCGAGVQIRVRQCDSPLPKHGGHQCLGAGVDELVCDTGVPCPIAGGWGPWGAWGVCDVTCGMGTQIKQRLCNAPLPQFGGALCVGDGAMVRPCDTNTPCPVHGNWGPWGSYGGCSVTCGMGVSVRERFCDSPPPSFGGSVCQGPIVEEDMCDTKVMCPVHGGWSAWSKFGPCSANCGEGITESIRLCDSPAPMYGGLHCEGPDYQKKTCHTGRPCAVDGGWGLWSAYSKCNVQCGKGFMARNRECSSPAPQYGGALCVGLFTEESVCDTGVSCPVHGLWSAWSPWGPCSASCEMGFRQRTRVCDNPSPMFGGMECVGIPINNGDCYTDVPCPVAGGWSMWSDPGPCSVTCGVGMAERVRECNAPLAMYGGPDCFGPRFEPLECDTGIPCPIHGGLSLWTMWGPCDAKCGVGMRQRSRACNNPVPMYGGMTCGDAPLVESEVCDSGVFCAVDGGWSFWTGWTACSVTCGKGFIFRERACDSPVAQYGGQPCLGKAQDQDVCDTGVPCPIHGEWSSWSALSACSVTCGAGTMFRIRLCNGPAPMYGGSTCPGPDMETLPCDTGVGCAVDGQWGLWSEFTLCKGKCGMGFKKRQRFCNGPEPMYGGAMCVGDNIDKVPCDTGLPCAIDGGWTPWSEYSACGALCGAGVVQRMRQCTMPEPRYGGAQCLGPNLEEAVCDAPMPCPVDGHWSVWSAYSACSETCGHGIMHRQRLCNNPEPLYGGATCPGYPLQKIDCDSGIPCPVDGGWALIGGFSVCSVTCGVGVITQTRMCTSPAPAYGGRDCVGPAIITEPCDTGVVCPVHGRWSFWSEWGACSVPCGEGFAERTRQCTTPLYGGRTCDGPDIETMKCDTGIYCAIDGGWGPWGAFSLCSETCGLGVRQKHRECNAPIPQYGGRDCVGEWTVTEPCDTLTPCPIIGAFSAWSVWSVCSAECGQGMQTRARLCDSPAPLYGGADCAGMYTEERVCQSDVFCTIHGGWGQWSSFSTCDKTCGVGTRDRIRHCDSPVPMYNGKKCHGDAVQVETCDTGVFCPVAGGWTFWAKWSACSVDCGDGVMSRTRSCTNPEPLFGGVPCSGETQQAKVCSTGLACAVHGNWGEWSAFSACVGTCGKGQQTRIRVCNNPLPQYGGNLCAGDSTDSIACDTGTPCAIDGGWGKWQAWTKCSAVCGMGETSRMRLCDSPAPVNGGSICYGKDLEIMTCYASKPCAVHGGWTYWSAWSDCSATCGPGTRMRHRDCTDPTPLHGGLMCDGPTEDFGNCDASVPCAVDGVWMEWSVWSSCRGNCGMGRMFRYRECMAPTYGGLPCKGPAEQAQECNTKIACMVHGAWSLWSVWGACEATCGKGVQTRVRACTNPAPIYGGSPCAGEMKDQRFCESGIPCAVHGGWSLWSVWGGCDVSCGKGFKYRIRTCTDPKPLYGGSMCEGKPEEKAMCDTGTPCAVAGRWSIWTKWDVCDAKCGRGKQVRLRTCTNPRPQYGGQICLGIPQETRDCDASIPCTVDGGWGAWAAWSTCDAACGKGRKTRARECDSPRPDYGGLPCLGFRSQVAKCDSGYLCVRMGGWTPWGMWSPCSTSCGAGLQMRERFCTNPPPLGPGMDCTGPAEDSRVCNMKIACPLHGQWASWSAFGKCIADCSYGPEHAEGFKFRERACTNPKPGIGGMDCVGDRVHKVPCETFPPCPEPVWGMWTKWTKCSAVCGTGDRTRTRQCIDMNTKQQVRGCIGQGTEFIPCIERPCPLHELNCSTECKWDNGIGYANYPGDCSLFVQCESINGIPQVHDCPWGLLYSLNILQCVYPDQSECKLCTTPGELIPYHISCRAYWECIRGRPQPRCCPVNQMFDPFLKLCVPDEQGLCDQPCGPVKAYQQTAPTRCSFRESPSGSSWYEQEVNGLWLNRPCGLGTVYSPQQCGCVYYKEGFKGTSVSSECVPELDVKFNNLKQDLAKNVGLHIEGVKYLGDGTAYFDGNAAINSNIFSNAEWGSNVYVYIRFKPDLTRVKKQGLVHNSGCGPSDIGPSVFIGFDRENQAQTGNNIKMKFAAVPKKKNVQYDFVNITVPAEKMLDSWFTFGAGQFSAEVNGLKAELAINSSHIDRRHGAINIGGNLCRIGNEAFEGFIGILDEVRIYKCKPKVRV